MKKLILLIVILVMVGCASTTCRVCEQSQNIPEEREILYVPRGCVVRVCIGLATPFAVGIMPGTFDDDSEILIMTHTELVEYLEQNQWDYHFHWPEVTP